MLPLNLLELEVSGLAFVTKIMAGKKHESLD